MAIDGIDPRLAVGQVETVGDGVVDVQQAHPDDLPGRQVDGRHMLAVDRRIAPAGAFARGLARHAEGGEGALLVHVPGLQAENLLVAEPGGFTLLDDQRADQSAAELLAAHQVRVVPVAAGVLGLELVDEALARLHRRLGNVRHAVHLDRQADAVPVDGGRFVQPVGEAHPQPLALLRPQLHAGALAAIGQRRTAEARDDLQVQRRGDQFVVVLLRHLRTRQPEARAAGAEADHRQPGEAAEHLSTGKCHGAFTFAVLRLGNDRFSHFPAAKASHRSVQPPLC